MNKSAFIPGPGNYNDSSHNIAKSAPKYGFGTGSRKISEEKMKAFIPGPG
jgi:hypothetical protein